MNNEDFTDKPRPVVAEERQYYRFQDYENDPDDYAPASFRQEPGLAGNYPSFLAHPNDEKHLDHLALGFKIYAAVNALFSSLPFIHLIFGIMMVTGGMGSGKGAPPPVVGWIFIIFALVFILSGYALSACNFYAGRFLKERRNYTFCFVMSCINCALMPLGTILGVFGIIVLVRDSVKNLFQDDARAD